MPDKSDPVATYNKLYGDAKQVQISENKLHEKAKIHAYASMKDVDLEKVKSRKDVEKVLTDALIQYRVKEGMIGVDKSGKPIITERMRQHLYRDVVNDLRRYGHDESDLVKAFKEGRGTGMIDSAMSSYKQTGLEVAHTKWYRDNVHEKGIDHVMAMAKAHKKVHNSDEEIVDIQSNLERKIRDKVNQDIPPRG